MWEWFKRQDFWDQLGYIFILITAIYCLYIVSILPISFKYAETKKDCGQFIGYHEQRNNPSRGGAWTDRWVMIRGETGKYYRFLYLKDYHSQYLFLRSDLQSGQEVCFEYFKLWLRDHNNMTLKSIELRGDK